MTIALFIPLRRLDQLISLRSGMLTTENPDVVPFARCSADIGFGPRRLMNANCESGDIAMMSGVGPMSFNSAMMSNGLA